VALGTVGASWGVYLASIATGSLSVASIGLAAVVALGITRWARGAPARPPPAAAAAGAGRTGKSAGRDWAVGTTSGHAGGAGSSATRQRTRGGGGGSGGGSFHDSDSPHSAAVPSLPSPTGSGNSSEAWGTDAAANTTTTTTSTPTSWLPWTRDDSIVAVVLAAASVWLWPAYSRRMLPSDEAGNLVTGGSCYGDLPIHMALANSFLVGVNTQVSWQTMASPIFAGAHMTYPFLPDFHAAVMVALGESMRTAFLLPGFALALSLIALLYYAALRLTRSRAGAVAAIGLTLLAGGMGGWRWAQSAGWEAAARQDVIQHDPTGEWKMLWFAFIPHILLPQRGANFAYPLAVLVIILVWRATDAAAPLADHHRASLLLHAAVLAAGLPMVQAHSFIGLAIIIAAVFLGDAHKWLRNGRLAAAWAGAGVAAIALAAPQLSQFTHTVATGFYGKFMTVGWLFHNYEFGAPYGLVGFYRFWWYSLGPALGLFTAAVAGLGVEAAGAAVAHSRAPPPPRVVGTSPVATAGDSRALATLAAGLDRLHDGVLAPLAAVTKWRALAALLRLDALDARAAALNTLSVCGRALDALKLAAGAAGVFLLGNYVNLQPWDRDNAKIFYIFVFVAAAFNGALLAAPFEYLLSGEPGSSRLAAWVDAAGCWRRAPTTGSGTSTKRGVSSVRRLAVRRLLAVAGAIAAPALFYFCTLSGYMQFMQEFGGNGVLVDHDAADMGAWMIDHVHPKAVVMHSNYHFQPSSSLAGRPSLVAYYGWVSNHGYNANDRLRDRDYVMDHALQDADPEAYFLCRRWGVRYLPGEHMRRHDRPSRGSAGFDEAVFLEGHLRRVHSAGRYDLLEVQGYDFPPG